MSVEQIVAILGVTTSLVLGIGSLINNRKSIRVGVNRNAEDQMDRQFVRTLNAVEGYNKILVEENKGLRQQIKELKEHIKVLEQQLSARP